MSDSDLIKLYSGRILDLAANIPHVGRLDAPDGSAKRRSPLCGSTVTVDVRVQGGRITAFAQDVKACALGQAAASVLGGAVVGRSRAEVEAARNAVAALLKSGGPTPAAPFSDFEVLIPAQDYKNRHASIMLALDATVEAMIAAEQKASD